MFEIHYTVQRIEGRRSPFPIDMLRYDSSFPASESDSTSIDSGLKTVQLTKRWLDRDWTPSERRWESFGWRVVGVDKVEERK